MKWGTILQAIYSREIDNSSFGRLGHHFEKVRPDYPNVFRASTVTLGSGPINEHTVNKFGQAM